MFNNKEQQNVLRFLGSIAFGNLVVAVIYCSRISVEMANERVSRNNRDDRSILILIFHLIFLILGSLAEEFNKLTFPYLAIHGTSYKESVIRSFTLLGSQKVERQISLLCVDYLLYTSLFFCETLLYVLNKVIQRFYQTKLVLL